MKPPVLIRDLSKDERRQLEAGLRSPDAFVLRRCQILLASAQGTSVKDSAVHLSCATQSVRNVIKAFNKEGLSVLARQSNRPKSVRPVLDQAERQRLHGLLQQSPRAFGKERSTWTLQLVAQVAHEQGISTRNGDKVLNIESVRVALQRLGMNWKRAKAWINSPDAAYARKKSDVIGCSL
jgi:transposase